MSNRADLRRSERLEAEAQRQGRSVDVVRTRFLDHELDRLDRERAVAADVLLVTATKTETHELELAVRAKTGREVTRQQGQAGRYRLLGDIGGQRVIAIKLRETGSYGPRGSAYTSYLALAETGATTLVGVGTAFGVNTIEQSIGDVLVSTSLVLYDEANIRDFSAGKGAPAYGYHYTDRARVEASIGWVGRLRLVWKNRLDTVSFHFGTLLAGASHVEPASFRDELVTRVQSIASDYDAVVGGEMEAAGLAAACKQSGTAWVVVKGISDFGTRDSRVEIDNNRIIAARNAASCVVDALCVDLRV